MHDFDPHDLLVSTFDDLESSLLRCMSYVPFVERNRGVLSPKFLPILTESCALIESIFRNTAAASGAGSFKALARALEPHLELEEATSIVLSSPVQLVRPFFSWTKQQPDWWCAYNRVKHDRLNNYGESVYAHAVSALAALHQVMARTWTLSGSLAKAGWFNEADEEFGEMLAARCAGSGPPEIAVESKLFVSAVRGGFVTWKEGTPEIHYWNFTERVKNFIWEYEGW